MESKKLQQFQQANSHLAPQKKIPLAYQTTVGDYRTSAHSPVFQNHLQYHHHQSNTYPQSQANNYQSPTSSGGSQLTPIDVQPQQAHMLMKSAAQSAYHHQQYGDSDQLYQSAAERAYQMARNYPHHQVSRMSHENPVAALQAQYQQLQQAKMAAQMQTQNEALAQQSRTFALRQQLNPPVPHFHMSQSSSIMSSPIAQQQQLQQQSKPTPPQPSSTTGGGPQHRIVPPSTLNLSSQFQPAQGPLKINNTDPRRAAQNVQQNFHSEAQAQALYQQHQQLLNAAKNQERDQKQQQQTTTSTPGSDPSPVYIQQNHPGHVVNQACQTQISGSIGTAGKATAATTAKSTPSSEESSTTKSPSHDHHQPQHHQPLDRKKSAGSVQALKLPLTKRPATSPVTISGWLYKQGSDGLKVWRKRWFVLAEYCLFYYKGPEEDKVLGAILLPSYKVSACLPEDKIYRKFAFKCEHTNMRTYWLAAENAETMVQWVKALTAATLMQASSESSDQTSQPSVSSLNHSGENSDSGIHTFQSQQSKMSVPQGPVTPASDTVPAAGRSATESNGGGAQPLYANAPPKPRRINDGGYSSPSPENSIERCENNENRQQQLMSRQQQQRRASSGVMSPSLQQMQRSQHHAIYDAHTGNVTSSLRAMPGTANADNLATQFQQQLELDKSSYYMQQQQAAAAAYNHGMNEIEEQMLRNQQRDDEMYGERELYMQKIIQQRYPSQFTPGSMMTYPNAERRTPDAYGRSKNRPFSDYEDIYHVAAAQAQSKLSQHNQQPSSGDLGAYRRPMSPPTYDSSKHVPSMPNRYTPNHLETSAVNHRVRPATASIIRPHSADFLEYEARAEAAAAAAIKPDPIRAPRPKSSLDINRAPDSLYYSEASYAEKMRQSALYLQKPQAQTAQPQHQQQQQQQQPPPIPPQPSLAGYQQSPYNGGAVHTIGYENPYERAYKRNELLNESLNQGASSIPRMSRSTTNSSIHGNSKDYQQQLRSSQQHLAQQNEQFLRSASARLPKRATTDDDGGGMGGGVQITPNTSIASLKDGERKREESMKRLLEWKQRMLQSPLTRKGIQQGGATASMVKLGSNPNILLAGNGIQRSRSETHANAGDYNSYSSDDEASISVRNVRNIPKVNLTVKPDPSDAINVQLAQSYYGTTNYDSKYAATPDRSGYNHPPPSGRGGIDIHGNYEMNNPFREARDNYNYPLRKAGSRAEIDLLERETSTQIRNLDMSAGDLLSRTHEELVLLLIQLRRQNSQTARAIEQSCTDIHEVQNRIRTSEGLTRAESIQRLDYLKQHLLDLEKQYEKSKPLVNLVDNMVKLGSLYRNNANSTSRQLASQPQRPESVTLDRLEFNQRMQERRMLQEEQKQWDRLSPNHAELQSKVRQLYQLDQLLQEESGTLQGLQRDKEDLERALGGLRARLQDSTGPPMVLEAAKKQQHILEKELSRVHHLLAENSKKLEQTVAGNARLEQELLMLRQKLQASRGARGSHGALGASHGGSGNDSIQYASTTTALLESELKRVQQLVGDMQRQRQELSTAVKQLTENSNRLYQEIGSKDPSITTTSSHIKKRSFSTGWVETDLDSMMSQDRTVYDRSNLSTPLYVDTSSANSSANIMNCSTSSKLSTSSGRNYNSYNDLDSHETSGMESDEFLDTNPFANLTNQEKQEIKTVRIVKRESERRHRDRERSTNVSTQNLDQVLEEDNNPFNGVVIHQDDLYSSRSQSLPRTYNDFYENNYTHKPAVGRHHQMNYTDYYNATATAAATANPYPVSMSDKNSNVPYRSKDKIISSSNHHRNSLSSSSCYVQQPQTSYALRHKTESLQSLTKSITDLSPAPVFQSEVARQIISEMSAGSASEDNNTEKVPSSHKHRRAVPKERRRHYTAPNNVNQKAMEKVQAENDMNRNNTNWRARDDLDMEVALRPRMNAPDVVRSALAHGEKISENTIDKLFGAPSKIVIPERYIPEKTPELSPEEKKRRQEKVEAIKKMLSEAPLDPANDTDAAAAPSSKITAEKKQREHLLQLNQILAQQVMQMSKIVAGNPSQSNQK